MKNFFKHIYTTIIIAIVMTLSIFSAKAVKLCGSLNNSKPKTVVCSHGLLAKSVAKTTTQVKLGRLYNTR